MKETASPFRDRGLACFLALLVLAVHGRTLAFPFVTLDDEPYIFANTALKGGLSAEGLRYAFTTGIDAGWIPLTWISRLADFSLFGANAAGHHAVNVLLHLLNALLLFRFLREGTGRPWAAAAAAALFAVHPLHVESVAWVTERKDVLCAFFFLLCLNAYLRYGRAPSAGRYGAVALLFVLSVLSKPLAVTLPFVLLLLDYWPLRRLPSPGSEGVEEGDPPPAPANTPARLLLEKVPLFLLSAAASAVTLLLQARADALSSMEAIPLWARAAYALESYGFYLWKALLPTGLAAWYPHPGARVSLAAAGLSGILLCAVTAAVLRWGRNRRWLPVGWFWYLGTLVPVIGLVQAGGTARADRCAYLPLMGIYLAVAMAAEEAVRRRRIPAGVVAAAAAALLLPLSALAFRQAGYWRDSGVLYRHALAVTGENWAMRNNYGILLQGQGKRDEAEAQFREALRIRPDYWAARNNYGLLLQEEGKRDEAVAQYREALRIRPDFAEAEHNLGVALLAAGRVDEAADRFREAIRLDPDDAKSRVNLGTILARRGSPAEAVALYREALRIRPAYPEALYDLAASLASLGEGGEAEGSLREALRQDPAFAEAHNLLGTLLADRGEAGEAEMRFREALRIRPWYREAEANLARLAPPPGTRAR